MWRSKVNSIPAESNTILEQLVKHDPTHAYKFTGPWLKQTTAFKTIHNTMDILIATASDKILAPNQGSLQHLRACR